MFGSSSSGSLIANDNDIIVYEFSPEYPSGKKVFSGWITKWKLRHKDGKIVINCISYGMDLNDYVLQTGTAYTAQITQATFDSPGHSDACLGNVTGYDYGWAQSFVPASSYSIGKVTIRKESSLSTNLRIGLRLWQGSPVGGSNTLLGARSNFADLGYVKQ